MNRIALYSHDALGLGHLRRNLAIARALAAGGSRSVLLFVGAREAGAFELPAGVDCVSVPALEKRRDGRYGSRSLALGLRHMLKLRSNTIQTALEAYAPDAFVVDKLALGVGGELEPALRMLKLHGTTRIVLGLRDVLDAPEVVRREWRRARTEEAIRRYYDAIWIYGDPAVYDSVKANGLAPEIAAKARYTGYLDRRGTSVAPRDGAAGELTTLVADDAPLYLCTVGGGQDGYAVADAFARAELPSGAHGLILTGPFMPTAARRRLRALAATREQLRVLELVPHPGRLIDQAVKVVAMGGYNTVCELLAREKRALIVPRTEPRTEQLIRARRMQQLRLLDMLEPARLTPEALGAWLARHGGAPDGAPRIDLEGLERIPVMLEELLDARPPARRPAALAAAAR
jgi:predicted glycosyltransferase